MKRQIIVYFGCLITVHSTNNTKWFSAPIEWCIRIRIVYKTKNSSAKMDAETHVIYLDEGPLKHPV